MKDNYLQHWGVKGMKWGVRRFQNKDGSLTLLGKKRYQDDDIVVKKGTVYRHVSEKQKIKLEDKETYLYDPKNDHDKNVYEGAYAAYIKRGKGYAKQYIHEYATKKVLVSPSDKRRVDIFIESYRNDPTSYINEMNFISEYVKKQKNAGVTLTKRNSNIASYTKKFDANTSDKDLRTYGYDAFNVLGEYGSRRSSAVYAYYKSVKDKGYNALIDDNNYKVYNDAAKPFIALNGKKTLKEIGVRELTDAEQQQAERNLREYMKKTYGHDHIAL